MMNIGNLRLPCRWTGVVAVVVMACSLWSCGKRAASQPVDAAVTDSAELMAEWAEGSTRIDPEDVAERGEEIRAQKRLICFDLDGTLTQHKTPLSPENRAVLDSLRQHYQLVMCGGGSCERIYNQMNQ